MNAKLAALSSLVRPATDEEVRDILRSEAQTAEREDGFVDAACEGRQDFWTSTILGHADAA